MKIWKFKRFAFGVQVPSVLCIYLKFTVCWVLPRKDLYESIRRPLLQGAYIMKVSVLSVYMRYMYLSHSVVSDSFVTPWTLACQAPLSMGFSRQEYWSGLPSATPGDLPDSGIKPRSPASPAGRFFSTVPPGKPLKIYT